MNYQSANSCDEVKAYYTSYPIPVAAALWCGVPPEDLQDVLKMAVETGRSIYAHHAIPCLEPRCRAIHDAIDNDKLPCGRDGRGRALESIDHVAPERRTVSRQDLKKWIAKEFPSDKPEFLFDKIERETHAAISAASFRALQADRDALNRKINVTEDRLKEMTSKYYEAIAQLKQNEAQKLQLVNELDPRAEKTYLNIVGALLECITGPYNDRTFPSETKLREFISTKYDGLYGVKERTLAEKFAAAKKSINGIE